MRGPERVVHVQVGHRGEVLGEGSAVRGFARVETEIFEQRDFSVFQLRDRALRFSGDAVGHELHGFAEEFLEPVRDRF